MAPDQYDLVIVGSGPASTAAAAFAAGLELRVAMVQPAGGPGRTVRGSGPTPSIALVGAARVAHTVARADRVGVRVGSSHVDLPAVWRHVRERHETADGDVNDLDGVELLTGRARLTGPNEVTVALDHDHDHDGDRAGGERILQARFVLLCTAGRATPPDVSGLDEVPFDTDETVFAWTSPPTSAIVLGGGPTAVELAQSFQRLGIATTLAAPAPGLLPHDEPSLVQRLVAVLSDEGLDVRAGSDPVAVRVVDGGIELDLHTRARTGEAVHSVRAAALVVCGERRPDVEGLGLDALGILVDPDGAVVVDERGRSTFRTVYAVDDVADGVPAAHAAEHAAVRAVRDMFFPGRVAPSDLVPWCTFADPELARVGLTTAEAEARHGDEVDVWRIDLDHDRRTVTGDERGGGGGTIVVVTAKDRVVGGHVLAPGASELIHELSLAVRHRLELTDLAQLVHVQSTVATSLGRLAAESSSERAHRYRWLVRRR